MARLALVLLLASAALDPAGAQPGASGPGEAGSDVILEGVAIRDHDDGGPPSLYDFRLLRADSSVVLTPLGRVGLDPGPLFDLGELPAATDSAAVVRLSATMFIMIAHQIEGALSGPEPDVFGLAVEDGHVRVTLARGVPLAVLVAGALAFAAVVAVATAGTFVARERRRAARSRAAARRQIEAGEAERVRVAREIHDGPLQDLHAVRARAAALAAREGRADDPISAEVSAVARELRAIAEGLRPPALGRFGLAAALRSHRDRFVERHPHVAVSVRADPEAPALSPEAEASAFRVVQEALQNAVEHGDARSVEVELAAGRGRAVRVEVRDDGTGLPSPPDIDALVAAGHFGLAGMRERAVLLGGSFSIGPTRPGRSPGGGTTVTLTLPLDR